MSTADVLTPMPALVRNEFDHDNYEVIDGVRVELSPMSADSQAIGSELVRHIGNHGADRNLGKAYAEMLFKLPLAKDRNRRPDVAFVSFAKWPKYKPIPSTNAWDVLPDLCVEVVSPNDVGDEIETKIGEYFAAGVSLVWVVYPRHEIVYVYDSVARVRRLTRGDTLDGGAVLPDFRLPLAELFIQPPPAQP